MNGAETKPLVLVVDDEADFREIVKAKLIKENFDVIEASNGVEAIEKALIHRPDVILLDVFMEKMDGIDTASHLHAHPDLKHIPFLFLTNYGDDAELGRMLDERYAQEIGAAAYFRKSDPLELLVTKIKELLSKQQVVTLDDGVQSA